jgi:hypothetical protein
MYVEHHIPPEEVGLEVPPGSGDLWLHEIDQARPLWAPGVSGTDRHADKVK